MTDFYDAIVVGAGAGGGIVACLLAEAGKRVLLLERGRNLAFQDVPRDHLRNQRLSQYGHNAGPDIEGNPRVGVNPYGQASLIRPHEWNYQNNAACVGGGTRVYGAQAWRFLEKDFRMATEYGVPEGSSLADWPITYADLEPYYDRAEWEIGVAGDGQANRFQGPRQRDYPMPPVPSTLSSNALQRGANALGWNTQPVPLLINTVPRHGRDRCIQCQYCVGFACPSDAKNGSQNTAIPRALATGLCTLLPQAMAERVDTDAQGKVVGVTYLVERAGGGLERIEARSKAVVVSGSAVETARLLFNSATEKHPNGLGNESDQLGRHLQGHYYPGAQALMEESVFDGIGPGPSISTCQFNHGNPGVIGGGMLANDFIKLPIIFYKTALPPDVPKWGLENKQWMRANYTRTLHIMGPVHDIPNPESRVTVNLSVRDKHGIPVAQVSGTTHPETVRTSQFMWERAREWLQASGAVEVWGGPPPLLLSGGQHQAGTCRMGNDPRTSVTDPFGRVHAHDNLFVADGSLHVTNGGFNPVLTIMAVAFRCGEHIARVI